MQLCSSKNMVRFNKSIPHHNLEQHEKIINELLTEFQNIKNDWNISKEFMNI
jgi:hypothetical protein